MRSMTCAPTHTQDKEPALALPQVNQKGQDLLDGRNIESSEDLGRLSQVVRLNDIADPAR